MASRYEMKDIGTTEGLNSTSAHVSRGRYRPFNGTAYEEPVTVLCVKAGTGSIAMHLTDCQAQELGNYLLDSVKTKRRTSKDDSRTD